MLKRWLIPVFYLVQKEFRQVFRDKAMLRIIFAMPLIQLFILSYAATNDIRSIRLSVFDADRTAESRELTRAFYQNDIFVPGPAVTAGPDLAELLYRGTADVTVWIPRDYAADLAARRPPVVGINVSGVNSSIAGRAMGYTEAIVRGEGAKVLAEWRLAQPALSQQEHRIEAVTRFFYNPELESRYYMVPAILVILITVISGMLTGMAVVREKEIGTLEQLLVTPLTSGQLMLGKIIPFAVLAFAELTLGIAVAVFWFHVPLAGSLWVLLLAALVYLLVTLGGGLLASTVSNTQQQAMFTVWFFLIFGIMTSGFFYPIENMPRVIYGMTYVNPLRYFVAIIRGIFLKGATLPDLLPNLIPLAIMGVLIFSIAVLRFQRRMK